MLTAADVMTTDVITVSPETTVREIAILLHSKRISGVPVVDAEKDVAYLHAVSRADARGRFNR